MGRRDYREPLSFSPDPEPDPRSFKPWWRRLGEWLGDFHKFVTTLLAIAGVTIAIHVWLKGLITRAELDLAVEVAVDKALAKSVAEMRADLEVLKNNTGGLPPWRAEVTLRLGKVEDKSTTQGAELVRVEERVDRYLVMRGR